MALLDDVSVWTNFLDDIPEFLRPVQNDQHPPVFPLIRDIHKDPLCLFGYLVSLDLYVCPRLKCLETTVVETGLDEQWVRILELRVPVQIVHPNTIEFTLGEHLTQRIHPVFAKSLMGGTRTQKSRGLACRIPRVVHRMSFRMPADLVIVSAIECGELSEDFLSFALSNVS